MIFYEQLQEKNPTLPNFETLDERVQRRLNFIFASYENYYRRNYNVTKKSKQRAVKQQLAKFIDEYKDLALNKKNQEKYIALVKKEERSRDANRIFHQSKTYGL